MQKNVQLDKEKNLLVSTNCPKTENEINARARFTMPYLSKSDPASFAHANVATRRPQLRVGRPPKYRTADDRRKSQRVQTAARQRVFRERIAEVQTSLLEAF